MFIKNPSEGIHPKKGVDKSKGRSRSYKAGHRLPVLAAEELLSGKKRRWIIEQLRHLSHLPEEHHQAIYEDLIARFAEFVQIVPSSAVGYLGSLLNESLRLGFASLYQYLHQPEKGLKKSTPNPLLLFAIFSAGLLVNIAKIATNQSIILTNEDGNFLKKWDPFSGSLKDFGSYYKIRFMNDVHPGVHYAVTLLLARQILPMVAFEWLSSDAQILGEWLNALRGNHNLDGRVSVALDSSKEIHQTNEDLLQELALESFEAEQVNCVETEHAEAFYQWLTQGLENKQFKVNTSDAEVHIVPQGVFLETKIFKQFTDVYNAEISPTIVINQFGNLMGIPKKGGNDTRFDQYFSTYPETRGGTVASGSPLSAFTGINARQNQSRMGVVVADTRLMFRAGATPTTSAYLKAASTASAAPKQTLPPLQNASIQTSSPRPGSEHK